MFSMLLCWIFLPCCLFLETISRFFKIHPNDIISLFHSTVITIAITSDFQNTGYPESCITSTRSQWIYTMYIILQYIMFDTIFHEFDKIEMYLHHILVLLGISYSLYNGTHHGLIAWVLLNEISTIFLNLIHLTQQRVQKIMKIFFIFTFFVFRVILLLWLNYVVPLQSFSVERSLLVIHTILNLYWFNIIVKKTFIFTNTCLLINRLIEYGTRKFDIID